MSAFPMPFYAIGICALAGIKVALVHVPLKVCFAAKGDVINLMRCDQVIQRFPEYCEFASHHNIG